jgi:enamine deaminase RidA (YjgF/YER057c/UK114 family)
MMKKRALSGSGHGATAFALKLSPGIVAGDFVFLTGMTGSRADGSIPSDAAEQFRAAFDKIGAVLAEDGLGHDAIVEMTSYHVGLRQHFDLFNAIRGEYVAEPWPAWTAVEVAGLRREGAIVEVRVVAMRGSVLKRK